MKNKKEVNYYENDMRHTADAPKLEKRLRKSLNVFGLILLFIAVYLLGSFLLCSCDYRDLDDDDDGSVNNEVRLSLHNLTCTADFNINNIDC